VAGRISGRSDRRLLSALAEATDAIATQCDLLADRIAARDTVSADIADSFGEEVTRLRAEVLHLQRLTATPPEPRGG
jgi:(p)ppGpp synthase/HD superfamily hydrolase